MNRQKFQGDLQTSCTVDATLDSIVADGFWPVKLTAGDFSVMASFPEGSKLHHKHGYGAEEKRVNHSAFVKEKGKDEPDYEQDS